jgi:hypothetical protein
MDELVPGPESEAGDRKDDVRHTDLYLAVAS